MIETNITKMLGIKHPILSAPMGPFYTTKLTVAVSEAGGLGVLSHVTVHDTVTLDEMKKSMEYVVEHTDKPFGFNIRTARLQPDAIKLCRQLPRFIMENPKIKEQCVYLITSAGSPRLIYNKHFEKLKESGSNIKHFHVAPSLYLANKLISSGVDGLVITGIEGGGHQSYENISTLVLLQQIRKELPDIPIIASGGYATGEGLASALSMGVGAIAMGTRFISTKECEFHDNYKKIVVESSASDTELKTGIFGPARVWKNKLAENHNLVETKEEKQASETSMSKVEQELAQLERTYEGKIEEGVAFLGQSAELIDSIESVSDIINTVINDAEKCLTDAYNNIKKISIKQIA
ncbi:MAG: NAD(P)H-dependent flavin oxidoreductase [Promethearchaeota archaeon]|jgi:NAD(P)H-dependent flavin oxidoreductase YrpB (nitropropane dioxygenase family)